jgi:nucleotide-binding universal stress UspA family protein/quercetin dioxygenase-like cupin family protein
MQTILHPTDFSDNSRPAFQAACSLARDYGARLVLLHVMPPSAAPILQRPPPNPLVPAEAQESLGRFPWPEPVEPGVRVEHRVAEGGASTEIRRLAQALKCDLIVMGTHGRSGLGRWLMGSVAEEVLRSAGCRVLVVKPPPPGIAPAEALARPGEVVDVRPLGSALPSAKTRALARTDELEVLRLVVPAGKEVPEHRAKGALVVQCLEGQVVFTAFGKPQDLRAGELLYLPAGEPHSVRGVQDASLLVTIVLGKR